MFRGEFYGTDFNYLYSEELRNQIDENCIEPNFLIFEAYQESHHEWNMLSDGRGDSNDA